jgi:hypothetical protein
VTNRTIEGIFALAIGALGCLGLDVFIRELRSDRDPLALALSGLVALAGLVSIALLVRAVYFGNDKR